MTKPPRKSSAIEPKRVSLKPLHRWSYKVFAAVPDLSGRHSSCSALAGIPSMRFIEFTPTAHHPTQSAPHVFGIESQKLTDIGERKNPRIAVVHEPFFGFAKPFFAGGIARAAVFPVIVNGVFENGSDQRCFGFEILAAPKGFEKLLRLG